MGRWNYTVDDTSPILDYTPQADGTASTGWGVWYSNSGWKESLPGGNSPSGVSYHVAGTSAASLTFNFTGVAVYVYGTANCTYSMTVDGTPVTINYDAAKGGVLAALDPVANGTHSVVLSPAPSTGQQFALDRFVVVMDDGQSGALRQTDIDATDSTSITYRGTWNTQNTKNIPSFDNPRNYQSAASLGASASWSFYGRAIALHGATEWGHGPYHATLDGVTSTYSGNSYLLVGDTTFYFASNLDPSIMHNFSLSSVSSDPKAWGIFFTGFSVYGVAGEPGPSVTPGIVGTAPETAQSATATATAAIPSSTSSPSAISSSATSLGASPSALSSTNNSSPSSTTSHAGAMGGGIAAGVIVIALIVLGALWYRRRRPHGRDLSPHLDLAAEPAMQYTYSDDPSRPYLPSATSSSGFLMGGLPQGNYPPSPSVSSSALPSDNASIHHGTSSRIQSPPPLSDNGSYAMDRRTPSASASGSATGSGTSGQEKRGLRVVGDPAHPLPTVPGSNHGMTTPPTNVSASTSASGTGAQPSGEQLDQLLQLLAQRIDVGRAGGSISGMAEGDTAPPEYRG